MWIHGDSLNNHCLMFAIIDEPKFKAWASENGKSATQETLEDQGLRDQVYADVIKLCKANKLNSLETPKQFHLQLDPWTVETDILTPTMKLKRNVARKQYADMIVTLYERPPIPSKK